MSINNRVLIVGGKKQVLVKAKKLGLEVIYIQKEENYDESHKEYVSRVILTDFTNIDTLIPLVKQVYKSSPFKIALSQSEFGLIPAAMINECLNLGGNSLKTVNLLKNKWEMRKFLNQVGISHVDANLGSTKQDIISFSKEYGFPIIIKPINGEGSYGIYKINNEEEIVKSFQNIVEMGLKEFLMEEYLDGKEYSVETFSFNGKHTVLAITEKLGYNNFVEIGHVVPARIEDKIENSIEKMVISFLNALGLKEGPSHTEIKVTSKGIKIVESHNRRAGGNINELVDYVYGIDMEILTLSSPFKLINTIEKRPEPKGAAAIMYIIPSQGRVTYINGIKDIEKSENLIMYDLKIDVNSIVKKLSWAIDRCGFIISKGNDSDSAIVNCRTLLDKLVINIESVNLTNA